MDGVYLYFLPMGLKHECLGISVSEASINLAALIFQIMLCDSIVIGWLLGGSGMGGGLQPFS